MNRRFRFATALIALAVAVSLAAVASPVVAQDTEIQDPVFSGGLDQVEVEVALEDGEDSMSVEFKSDDIEGIDVSPTQEPQEGAFGVEIEPGDEENTVVFTIPDDGTYTVTANLTSAEPGHEMTVYTEVDGAVDNTEAFEIDGKQENTEDEDDPEESSPGIDSDFSEDLGGVKIDVQIEGAVIDAEVEVESDDFEVDLSPTDEDQEGAGIQVVGGNTVAFALPDDGTYTLTGDLTGAEEGGEMTVSLEVDDELEDSATFSIGEPGNPLFASPGEPLGREEVEGLVLEWVLSGDDSIGDQQFTREEIEDLVLEWILERQ